MLSVCGAYASQHPALNFFLTWLLAINGIACRMLNASATPASARNPFCCDAKRIVGRGRTVKAMSLAGRPV